MSEFGEDDYFGDDNYEYLEALLNSPIEMPDKKLRYGTLGRRMFQATNEVLHLPGMNASQSLNIPMPGSNAQEDLNIAFPGTETNEDIPMPQTEESAPVPEPEPEAEFKDEKPQPAPATDVFLQS